MTEKRATQQHSIVIAALCTRSDGSEFHAVTIDMSSAGLRLRSATLPRAEERLVCNIRSIGAVNTQVVSVGACDFIIRVIGTNPTPGAVARRLVELIREQSQASEIVRVHRRIVPVRTDVQVTLEDGTRVSAQIVNLSVSGVALHLDLPLAIGQSIRIGRWPATVARRIEHGIGAAFLEPLDAAALGEETVL